MQFELTVLAKACVYTVNNITTTTNDNQHLHDMKGTVRGESSLLTNSQLSNARKLIWLIVFATLLVQILPANNRRNKNTLG